MVHLFYVPSLKQIVMNGVSIKLCCKRDILSTIELNSSIQNQNTNNTIIDRWISRIRTTVDRIVNQLALPSNLKKEINGYIIRIGVEIQQWKFSLGYFTDRECTIRDFLLKHFDMVSWSPFGEIDEKQTVKNIIEFSLPRKLLSTSHLLHMACYFCLEETTVRLLFAQLESNPLDFISEITKFRSPIMAYWLCRLENSSCQQNLVKIYQYSIVTLNLPAMEYFFSRMSVEEKNATMNFVRQSIQNLCESCVSSNRKFYPACHIVHLISKLTVVEQNELFRTFSYGILTAFLQSSRRILFPHLCEILVPYLTLKELYELLLDIAWEPDEPSFEYSENIFMKIFETCSMEYKKKLLRMILKKTPHICCMLYQLVKRCKTKCIHLLLLFSSPIQRRRIKKIIQQQIRPVRRSTRLKNIR